LPAERVTRIKGTRGKSSEGNLIFIGGDNPGSAGLKDIGKQNGQIKKGIDVAENAKAMAKAMKQVAAFWKGRTSEVAMKTCKECRDGALAIAKAAQADDQAGVKAGMKMVGAGCKGCHDVHREKTGENQYKIKQ
jgi:hypothetical protein